MVGSKDLRPLTIPFFPNVFYDNQFRQKPLWPAPNTNLSGKTVIITGSNTGLGYESASQLLSLHLTHLILAVRSPSKGEAAALKLRKAHPTATIAVWSLDMSEYSSIQAFCRRIESELERVDMVLLNAGVGAFKYVANKRTGHHECIQVNYLSTVLLAMLLLPILKRNGPSNGSPARLTIVNAAVTLVAKFPERDAVPVLVALDEPKNHGMEIYQTSKLLAHMWLWKAVEYVDAEDVVVNLADCAWVKGTEFLREVGGVARVGLKIFELLGRTPRVGASCFVDAMVSKGKESHGCFLMSWKIHPVRAPRG